MVIRHKEITEGILVTNKDASQLYGKSKSAGRKAAFETALTRACMPLINLGIPVSIIYLL